MSLPRVLVRLANEDGVWTLGSRGLPLKEQSRSRRRRRRGLGDVRAIEKVR